MPCAEPITENDPRPPEKICPFLLNDPQSIEGKAAFGIACRPGVMQRAGMSGVATGFDWNALLAIAAAERIQSAIAVYLFSEIETGAMAGLAAKEGE